MPHASICPSAISVCALAVPEQGEWRLAQWPLQIIRGSFSCPTLGPGRVVIASDELLTYQTLRAGGNVEKGNELLVRRDTGICPMASVPRCVGGWVGSAAWAGAFGVVMLRRGRVLWLVRGRLGVLSHPGRAQSKGY